MIQTSEKKLQIFFAAFPQKMLPKQHIIIGGVKAPKEILYLEKGFVRQYIISPDGEEKTTMIYGPSDIFSLIWGILRKERPNRFLESITPVTVRTCSRDAFLKLLVSDPTISYAVLEQTLKRFDDFLQSIAYVSHATKAPTKVLAFLLLLSQRFGEKTSHNFLPFVLTHKDIAGSIGLSRETVSIVLKKLIDSGVVIQKNHLLGVDLRKRKNTHLQQVRDLLS